MREKEKIDELELQPGADRPIKKKNQLDNLKEIALMCFTHEERRKIVVSIDKKQIKWFSEKWELDA